MQKILYAFLVALGLFVSCGKGGKIKVKGNFSNIEGQTLFLKELTANEILNIDSAKITSNGNFKFSFDAEKTAFYMLYLSRDQNVTLLIHPGDRIFITADGANLQKTYTVEGSDDCLLIKQLSDRLQQTLHAIDGLNKIYNDSLGTANILKTREMLDSMYNEIETGHRSFTKEFIIKNVNSMAALMALYQQLGPRRPVLNPANDYDLYKMVDSAMMLNYPEADATQSLHTLMAEINAQQQRKIALQQRTAIGAIAPDIALPSRKGDTIKLSSLKGKYVLLSFWASWNDSSKIENANLGKNYWRYKDMGFEILQVGIEKSAESWQKAITDNGLYWLHVSDFKMWKSPAAIVYGINKVPANFLIDREGVIIAKNLRGDAVREKLKEIFKY